MFVFKIYLALFILMFLLLSVFGRRLGLLEATIITCGILFLIFDMRKELDDLKKLEAKVASFSPPG